MPDEKDAPIDPGTSDEEIEIEFIDEESGLMPVEPDPVVAEDVVQAGSAPGEVERLKTELDHVRDIYLRKLAEFDNYRKRTEREREEFRKTAGEELVKELLPVLDNFERALQHEEGDGGSFREGVEMIAKQLKDTLERQGVVEIDPEGEPFDPEFHEAVQRVETSQHVPGVVVWVMVKGYTFGDRLIRPAMVGVAVEPENRASIAGPAGGRGEGAGDE
ncbi:MAG: nucleotide exchange factor GrpE [Thermoanaerobaculales bacterium]